MSQQFSSKIQNLIDVVQQQNELTPEFTKNIVIESDIQEADLENWADFNYPQADSYGRKLLYDGGHFEIMVMSWRKGNFASLHDHGYTQWGAVKIFGKAEHAIFEKHNNKIITIDRREFSANKVVAVGHDFIHQMGNFNQEPFLSFHLYGAYGKDGNITADARIFDLYKKKILYTGGGVFFNPGVDTYTTNNEAIEGEFFTALRFTIEHLKRVIAASFNIDENLKTQCYYFISPQFFKKLRQEKYNLDTLSPAAFKYAYKGCLSYEIRALIDFQCMVIEKNIIEDKLELLHRLSQLRFVLHDDLFEEYLDVVGDKLIRNKNKIKLENSDIYDKTYIPQFVM